ncbi:MAG: AsnC family transcriptional regulator [Rhodospirillales bacterium]|nr:AsnC family transcriptional regulator [Rhodospirillales bacterium]
MIASALDRRLLNDYQRDFPLASRPFAKIAADLGVAEGDVITRYAELQAQGAISRVGAVVRPHALGVSTLAAVAVPDDAVEDAGRRIAAHPEVNHCYEREHTYNIWFVVTAKDEPALRRTLTAIEEDCGTPVLDLPLVEAFHIDLGFAL